MCRAEHCLARLCFAPIWLSISEPESGTNQNPLRWQCTPEPRAKTGWKIGAVPSFPKIERFLIEPFFVTLQGPLVSISRY